jgi:hypothetical protein
MRCHRRDIRVGCLRLWRGDVLKTLTDAGGDGRLGRGAAARGGALRRGVDGMGRLQRLDARNQALI